MPVFPNISTCCRNLYGGATSHRGLFQRRAAQSGHELDKVSVRYRGDSPDLFAGAELEAKYLLLFLFGMGALAAWAGSEAVLPAYMIGMVLAGTVGKDHALIRRLRTLTFGLLTPFYFIRAGSFVSIPALIGAPLVVLPLLGGKMATKFVSVYPATKVCGNNHKDSMYTTLLMSTGLTFGSISALFGLTHNVIDKNQYSFLIAAIVLSAVVPTLIANAFYLPRHLLRHEKPETGPGVLHGQEGGLVTTPIPPSTMEAAYD
jgi:Kef-type K+ transport system membrane component KefB